MFDQQQFSLEHVSKKKTFVRSAFLQNGRESGVILMQVDDSHSEILRTLARIKKNPLPDSR